jgi:hypothetical protein
VDFDMQELFQLDVQISYQRIEKSLKRQVTSYSKAECALNQHFMRFGLFLQSMWTTGYAQLAEQIDLDIEEAKKKFNCTLYEYTSSF